MVTDKKDNQQEEQNQPIDKPVEEISIDIQSLAEEVFRLLKKELQLENERRGR